LTYSLRWHYGPGIDSACNGNEYHEDFLGGTCGRCVRLATLPPSCDFVMKSGNLNFLEPSGPLQAWNVTALPSPFNIKWGRGSAVAPVLRLWFRIPQEHGYLPLVRIVCLQIEVSASGWSLVQRSPNECCVSAYDREDWPIKRPVRVVVAWMKMK